eukprot:c39260_g1_i1.p1 GENE.c39260_g1_i1~~c39260_g1_i1.p1  ORF type:complete len:324 (+),score=76.35 c39260_g1_i1:53-1024(+)
MPCITCTPRTKKRLVRLLVLAIVIGIIVVLSIEASSYLNKARKKLQSVPLYLFVLLYLLLNIPRKLFPILYYIFPIGTLVQFYAADRYSAHTAALLVELLKLQDLVFFIAIRYLYSGVAEAIFDPEAPVPPKYQKFMKYFSSDFQTVLAAFDKKWLSIIQPDVKPTTPSPEQKPTKNPLVRFLWLRHGLIIIAWACSLYMEDYVNLFWLATRSRVSTYVYLIAFPIATVAEYPKTFLKIRVLKGVADVSTGAAGILTVLKDFSNFEWYDAVGLVVIVGVSTVLVHGVHLHLVVTKLLNFLRSCRNPPPVLASPTLQISESIEL